MAKAKSDAPAAEAESPKVSPEQRKLAIKAVCAIIGCGSTDGATRVDEMPADKVFKIAELERSNKRREVVALLYS
jgi:hypothetical protein